MSFGIALRIFLRPPHCNQGTSLVARLINFEGSFSQEKFWLRNFYLIKVSAVFY